MLYKGAALNLKRVFTQLSAWYPRKPGKPNKWVIPLQEGHFALLRVNDWMVKVDLKDASKYHPFEVHGGTRILSVPASAVWPLLCPMGIRIGNHMD